MYLRVVDGVGLGVIKFYGSLVLIPDKKVNIYIVHTQFFFVSF